MKAKRLWLLWQELLLSYALCFTRPGVARFAEWVTGLALNVEEHTVTQSLIALDRPADWKALEAFVEYGAWHPDLLEATTARLRDDAPGRLFHGYHVGAADDTKVHRSSKDVWGTYTFHAYTARCPHRAPTVRAHKWVAFGALLLVPEQPAWYLPTAGRLYFRASQLPGPGSNHEPPVVFRTTCELLVEMARQHAQAVPGAHLAVFDGGFALRRVVRPLVLPPEGLPRVEVVTRLRGDAVLYERPPAERPPGQRGRPRKWGRRLPPPRQGGRWPGPWHEAAVFLYGRRRRVRYKQVVCLWRVLGPEVPAKAVAAEVEGYRERFPLVTSAVDLTGAQVLEVFGARYRQEDGIRDLKQRLGWEECRAWTRQPIEGTTRALFVCLTLLRLLQLRLEACGETDWWLRPPWNRRKVRPSVLDLERLLREHRRDLQQFLAGWLGNAGKANGVAAAEDSG